MERRKKHGPSFAFHELLHGTLFTIACHCQDFTTVALATPKRKALIFLEPLRHLESDTRWITWLVGLYTRYVQGIG